MTIINDILDFSKIESGKMAIEDAPFELGIVLKMHSIFLPQKQ
jgi:signal transduction histidine kinase